MLIYEITFSPTGGTQRAADILTDALVQQLSASKKAIDLSDSFLDESDLAVPSDAIAVIAMPCFGGRAPQVALERLSRIKGNGARCVVMNVYGNRDFDDALLEMEDGALACGFEVLAAIAAIAEHSIMHQFATGRPDVSDKENLTAFAIRIARQLEDGENTAAPRVPGNSPYKDTGAVPLVPKVTKKCVACGRCAEKCPVTAINTIDYAADKNICIACMRCMEVCPEDARHINKLMVKAASMAISKVANVRKECKLYI